MVEATMCQQSRWPGDHQGNGGRLTRGDTRPLNLHLFREGWQLIVLPSLQDGLIERFPIAGLESQQRIIYGTLGSIVS